MPFTNGNMTPVGYIGSRRAPERPGRLLKASNEFRCVLKLLETNFLSIYTQNDGKKSGSIWQKATKSTEEEALGALFAQLTTRAEHTCFIIIMNWQKSYCETENSRNWWFDGSVIKLTNQPADGLEGLGGHFCHWNQDLRVSLLSLGKLNIPIKSSGALWRSLKINSRARIRGVWWAESSEFSKLANSLYRKMPKNQKIQKIIYLLVCDHPIRTTKKRKDTKKLAIFSDLLTILECQEEEEEEAMRWWLQTRECWRRRDAEREKEKMPFANWDMSLTHTDCESGARFESWWK